MSFLHPEAGSNNGALRGACRRFPQADVILMQRGDETDILGRDFVLHSVPLTIEEPYGWIQKLSTMGGGA